MTSIEIVRAVAGFFSLILIAGFFGTDRLGTVAACVMMVLDWLMLFPWEKKR